MGRFRGITSHKLGLKALRGNPSPTQIVFRTQMCLVRPLLGILYDNGLIVD